MTALRIDRRLAICVALIGSLGIAAARADVLIATAAPMSGRFTWTGEQWQRAAELAVEDINKKDGLLGQQVGLVLGDDACDEQQAIALARSLIERHVHLVVGHGCSGPAIAVAPLYEAAGVIMIAPSASNPALTDAGRPNMFRVFGRDDLQGRLAAEYLAKHYPRERIGIIFDDDAYGRGLASETKRRLNELGIKEALFFGSEQNSFDWVGLVQMIRGLSIRVVYFAARTANVGLLARHLNGAGDRIQIVSGDAVNAEDFWLIAGPAGEGTVFTSGPDARGFPAGADVVVRFRERGYEPEGFTLYIYAAVQAWSQAVAKAGTLDPATVMRVLHEAEFDTVLGRIGFDEKGDVEGIPPFVWFVWRDGNYVPLK